MIKEILAQLEKGPTIMTLLEIMNLMNLIQDINIECIFKEDEVFLKILDILVVSYLDSAIFEVNSLNKPVLEKFSTWLLVTGNKHLFGKNRDDLSAYSSVFIQTM